MNKLMDILTLHIFAYIDLFLFGVFDFQNSANFTLCPNDAPFYNTAT